MAAKEEKRVVSVIGGDLRSLYAARYLAKKGCLCRLFYLGDRKNPCAEGFDKGCCTAPYKLAEAVSGADCLLLPLPLSLDGRHLNAPFSSLPPSLLELEGQIPPKTPLFGGGLSRPAFENREGLTFDFLKDEDFAAKNALPTAEGALALAILHYKGLLFGSRCALLGYGRISSALLPLLLSMGAHCTVFARREEARLAAAKQGALFGASATALVGGKTGKEWVATVPNAKNTGQKEAPRPTVTALPFEDLQEKLPDLDILFNTVPHTVFTPDHCALLKKEALFIELASRPFGMSDEARQKLGERHLFALGLPGKYAPIYAGTLIGKTLLSVLTEQEGPPPLA